MDNKEFDEIIKKKLESLGSVGTDHWDEFKEKWDAEQSSHLDVEELEDIDSNFDEKIKANLQNLRMPFNSDHWVRLKKQLEAEAIFRKKLYVAKTVEIIMLALMVVTIINIWPIKNDIYEIPVYDVPMVASIAVDKSTAENFKKSELRAQEQTIAPSIIKIFTSNLSTDLDKSSYSITLANNSLDKLVLKSIDAPDIFENVLFNELLQDDLGTRIDKESIIKSGSDRYEKNKSINTLQKNLELPHRPIGFPDITLPAPIKEKESTFLNVSIGPKVNVVNSPFDPVYEVDPYNIWNTNFSISATLDKKVGPLDLYAGLGYTNTSYSPIVINEEYFEYQNEYQTNLDNIKFKTLNIPIGAKINVLDNPGFGMYIRTGLDLHLIADSEYEIKNVPKGRSTPSPVPTPGGGANLNSKLSQKSFHSGILSGGSLSDNLYASATLGIGMNKSLSNRLGLYVEPKYNHFISSKGIGPNQDKIHAFSVDLGMRYRLN